MFKNMLKRSWLSTIRKPSRTIILVIILFVMANMLLATVAIRNSVNKSVEYAKEKLGGIVYLQPDTDKMREQMEAARQNATNGDATPVRTTSPTISEDLAKGIADSNYIKDYTYSIVTTTNADGYTVVETAQNEREKQFRNALDDAKTQVNDQVNEYNSSRNQYNANGSGEGPRGSGRPNFNFNFNVNISGPNLSRGDTEIQGINSFDFISDVEAGNMKIIDGSAFDEKTENGVVISSELATANNIKVGDEIKFKTVADEPAELAFKVVGIYQTSTENFNYNTIYTNIDGAKKFMTTDQIDKLTVQNVRYYLTSASDKDAFLAAIAKKYPNLATDNLKLDIDDSSYQTMVGPIENVGSFAMTIMWVVIIAAVVIITLIVVINVKDRKYEMGVLLSLGSNRTGILGQVFIELVIVGTIGFLASLGTSQILAQKMGEGLLAQQVAASETTTNTNETKAGYGNRGLNAPGGFMRSGQTTTTNVEKIDEIDVSAGVSEYLTLFGAGYLIIIIAMILPSVNILRYQPKTILTGKE